MTTKWVIATPYGYGDEAYWSNAMGWVDLDSADRFTEAETKTVDLPMEGFWIPESEAK